jgi:hypothetical protein
MLSHGNIRITVWLYGKLCNFGIKRARQFPITHLLTQCSGHYCLSPCFCSLMPATRGESDMSIPSNSIIDNLQ